MRADEHSRETERLDMLRRLRMMDGEAESEFDDIVDLASTVCGAPIALITLLDADRQWFKAKVGTEITETPRDQAICAHAILEDGVTVIPDTLADLRTRDNPICYDDPNVRFYAGAPLTIDEGLPIGTLCVLDTAVRDLTIGQKHALRVLADQVAARIALRRELERSRNMLREVDHRVKNSLSLIASMLSLQGKSAETSEAREAIELARSRVMAVTRIHEQLHQSGSIHEVDLAVFLARMADDLMSQSADAVEITVACAPISLPARDSVNVGIAVNEIVTNAIRHGFEEDAEGKITISARRHGGIIEIEIANDGKPLPEGFDPAKSRGLGMRVVSSTARQKGGALTWSQDQNGVQFVFSFVDPHAVGPAG